MRMLPLYVYLFITIVDINIPRWGNRRKCFSVGFRSRSEETNCQKYVVWIYSRHPGPRPRDLYKLITFFFFVHKDKLFCPFPLWILPYGRLCWCNFSVSRILCKVVIVLYYSFFSYCRVILFFFVHYILSQRLFFPVPSHLIVSPAHKRTGPTVTSYYMAFDLNDLLLLRSIYFLLVLIWIYLLDRNVIYSLPFSLISMSSRSLFVLFMVMLKDLK